LIAGTGSKENIRLVEIPKKLAPIFVALVSMDKNLKKIIKDCNPTISELQWIIDFENEYTSEEHKVGHIA
jgi:glycyl-tRNA synthetase (class II)